MTNDSRKIIFGTGAWKYIVSVSATVLVVVVYILFGGDMPGDRATNQVESIHPGVTMTPGADPSEVVLKKEALKHTVKEFAWRYYNLDGRGPQVDYRDRLLSYVTERFLKSYAIGPSTPQAQAYVDQGWAIETAADMSSFDAELPSDMSYAHVEVEVRMMMTSPSGKIESNNSFDLELTVLMTEDGWRIDRML